MKRILIGCEFSQVVCKAFRDAGYEAYSCDLLAGEINPDWHYQCDVLEIMNDNWDLCCFHPPCTYLTNSGVRWLYNKDGGKNYERWSNMADGAEFFRKLLNAKCDKIVIENPIPHKYALHLIGERYSQIIQPWMFGTTESKATCLWLKNLPLLIPTDNVREKMKALPKSETHKVHYAAPSEDRWKIRSKTYQCFADAFVNQWGKLL